MIMTSKLPTSFNRRGRLQPTDRLSSPPFWVHRLYPGFAKTLSIGLLGSVVAMVLVLSFSLVGTLQAAQDDSKALRERAKTFWEARVKGDWATVYDYLSEAEISGRTKEQYVAFSKEKGPFTFTSYTLGEVDVDGDLGWVKTVCDFYPTQFRGVRPTHMDRWEIWEKVDGKWYPVSRQQYEDYPKLPPRLRPLAEEKAVTARANGFWQAREKNDYTSVYQHCSPAFRESIPVEEFLSKKAQYLYVSHQILWAEVEGDRANVRVTVSYRPNDPHLTKMTPVQETIVQPWIKVNNQWFVEIEG
jgi:hypothetical protein